MRRLSPLIFIAMIATPVAALGEKTPAPPAAPRAITLEQAVTLAQRNALAVVQAHGNVR